MTDPLGTSGWWLILNHEEKNFAAPMSRPDYFGGADSRYIVGWTYDPAVVIKFLRGEAVDYEHV